METKKSNKKEIARIDKFQKNTVPTEATHSQLGFSWASFVSSSALFSLFLTATIFMIGWSYITNWYAYFGISAENIDASLQQVLIYSVEPIVTTLLFFALGCFLFPIFIAIRGQELNLLESNSWFSIIMISIGLALGYELYFWVFQKPNGFASLNENIYLISLIVSIFYILLIYPFYLTFNNIRISISKLFNKSNNVYPDSSKNLKLLAQSTLFYNLKWVILSIITFVTLLSLAATLGTSDAESGRRGSGGIVQKVYLISSNPISAIENLKVQCSETCSYGPLGLIAENDNAFYVANWNRKNGLDPNSYIIPRTNQSESFFIVPVR